eukprot:1995327-Pyramimonas_sp.AAC.1
MIGLLESVHCHGIRKSRPLGGSSWYPLSGSSVEKYVGDMLLNICKSAHQVGTADRQVVVDAL